MQIANRYAIGSETAALSARKYVTDNKFAEE
jgi:hypothetical protein